MEDKRYWIWLANAAGAGSRLPMNLLRKYSTVKAIYDLTREEITEEVGTRRHAAVNRLSDKDLSRADEILAWCRAKGVSVLTPDEEDYPKSLLQLRDPPMVLYYVGKLPRFNHICSTAVVGTRKMSDYGKKAAYDIGYGLAEGGACVVSGMALGIDGTAMSGAIAAEGITAAVIGSGIDIVYPHEHTDLFKEIIKNGAVITEYAPGTPPNSANFPVRNRIISGLCQGTVVVEADERSGALITARHALYQGRDLYAVPGRIGEANSEGSLKLIKAGARLVTNASDILRNYEFMYPHLIRVPSYFGRKGAKQNMSVDEAAELMHISSTSKKKYYGNGVYGGKDESAVKAKKPAAKSAPKADPKPKAEPEAKPSSAAEAPVPAAARSGGTIPQRRIDLDMLGESEIKIFKAMQPDVPVLPDEIAAKGFSLADVMSAMTLLEISGVVECGAGGYYLARSADSDMIERHFDGIGD